MRPVLKTIAAERGSMTNGHVRQATDDDYDAVASFTRDTWAERETADYVPDVFRQWVDDDGPDQRTVVAEVETDGGPAVVGVAQGKRLSDHEAWIQGLRVAPDHRGDGRGLAMIEDLFAWAREAGAAVARSMVFGWNDAGMGQSMAAGFAPRTSFRWATPEPRSVEPDARVADDPAAAWSYWARSEGRDALGGLALDPDEGWAASELTRERLRALADDERVVAVGDGGTRGMAARVRTTERPGRSGSDELAEYAVGAWTDAAAAEALFDAVRADAADLGVAATRVLIPESPRHVAEAAAARTGVSEHADFVFEADLTGES